MWTLRLADWGALTWGIASCCCSRGNRRKYFGRCVRSHSHSNDVIFKLFCAYLACVFSKNSMLRIATNYLQFCIAHVGQVMQHIFRGNRKQDFSSRRKERVKARPVVGDKRASAGSRFKQSHRWRIAGPNHVTPRDVQRQSR